MVDVCISIYINIKILRNNVNKFLHTHKYFNQSAHKYLYACV